MFDPASAVPGNIEWVIAEHDDSVGSPPAAETKPPLSGKVGCLIAVGAILVFVGPAIGAVVLLGRRNDLDACKVVTAADVSSVLGRPDVRADRSVTEPIAICNYSVAGQRLMSIGLDPDGGDLVRLYAGPGQRISVPGADLALLSTIPADGVGLAEIRMARGSRSATVNYDVPVSGADPAEETRALTAIGSLTADRWLRK